MPRQQYTSKGRRGPRELAHTEIVHLHLAGQELAGADFSGADFVHADFENADLRNTEWRGAEITHLNIKGADLRGSNLFEVARIIHVQTDETIISPGDPADHWIYRGTSDGLIIESSNEDNDEFCQARRKRAKKILKTKLKRTFKDYGLTEEDVKHPRLKIRPDGDLETLEELARGLAQVKAKVQNLPDYQKEHAYKMFEKQSADTVSDWVFDHRLYGNENVVFSRWVELTGRTIGIDALVEWKKMGGLRSEDSRIIQDEESLAETWFADSVYHGSMRNTPAKAKPAKPKLLSSYVASMDWRDRKNLNFKLCEIGLRTGTAGWASADELRPLLEADTDLNPEDVRQILFYRFPSRAFSHEEYLTQLPKDVSQWSLQERYYEFCWRFDKEQMWRKQKLGQATDDRQLLLAA